MWLIMITRIVTESNGNGGHIRAWDVMSSNLLVTTSFASGQNIVDQKYRQFSFRRCYATRRGPECFSGCQKTKQF